MLQKSGVPTAEDLAGITPDAVRLTKGPCAIVECFQKIPCNPCATSCPTGAIASDNDINELPVIDWERCVGCGICIAVCPGLAIFVVDNSSDPAIVRLPYEFLPLPGEGTTVTALSREGSPIGTAKVLRVQNSPAQDRTPIVWLEVALELSMQVRHFRLD